MVDAARRTIPGLRASGAAAADDVGREIRGSTTILELLRMFPDGRAAKLMGDIQFPCAHCGCAVREPLTLAATATGGASHGRGRYRRGSRSRAAASCSSVGPAPSSARNASMTARGLRA